MEIRIDNTAKLRWKTTTFQWGLCTPPRTSRTVPHRGPGTGDSLTNNQKENEVLTNCLPSQNYSISQVSTTTDSFLSPLHRIQSSWLDGLNTRKDNMGKGLLSNSTINIYTSLPFFGGNVQTSRTCFTGSDVVWDNNLDLVYKLVDLEAREEAMVFLQHNIRAN